MRSKSLNNHGYTLVEIVIVIVILGIIGAFECVQLVELTGFFEYIMGFQASFPDYSGNGAVIITPTIRIQTEYTKWLRIRLH